MDEPGVLWFVGRTRTVVHLVVHSRARTNDRSSTLSPAASQHPRPESASAVLAGLLLDPVGELGDLVVDAAALGDQLADLLVGVHHRGVVAAAELLADLGQRQVGELAAEVHRDLPAVTRTRLRLEPHRSSIDRPK